MIFREKLYVLFALAVVFFLQSCGVSCWDKAVEEYFDRQLSIIEKQLEHTTVIAGEPMFSVFAMEKITGISSSVQYGDVSLYKSHTDYEADKKRWINWLHNEGCDLSTEELNRIVEKLEARNGYLIN